MHQDEIYGIVCRHGAGVDGLHANWPGGFPERGTSWQVLDDWAMISGGVEQYDRAPANPERQTFAVEDLRIHFESAKRQILIERHFPGRTKLYIFETNGYLLFTTDLLNLMNSIECKLDVFSAIHYLSFGTPSPGGALISGVKSVQSGETLKIKPSGSYASFRSFDPMERPDLPQGESISAAIEARIAYSADQAVSRPGAALLLSGGVDSSYVASRIQGRDVPTFTTEFPDVRASNEVENARQTANHFGLRHSALPIDSASALLHLEQMADAAVPQSAWTVIVHRELARQISSFGNSCIISGLGADEIFGGYGAQLAAYGRLAKAVSRTNYANAMSPMEILASGIFLGTETLFTGVAKFTDKSYRMKALKSPWNRYNPEIPSLSFYRQILDRKPDAHIFETMVAHESGNRIPELLVSGFERELRYHGLQGIYPFLDQQLVQLAGALRPEQRFRKDGSNVQHKLLWRQIAAKSLPDYIFTRPTAIYDAPLGEWMRSPKFASIIVDGLKIGPARFPDIFRSDYVDGLIAELIKMRDPSYRPDQPLFRDRVWIAFTLFTWCNRWIDP